MTVIIHLFFPFAVKLTAQHKFRTKNISGLTLPLYYVPEMRVYAYETASGATDPKTKSLMCRVTIYAYFNLQRLLTGNLCSSCLL